MQQPGTATSRIPLCRSFRELSCQKAPHEIADTFVESNVGLKSAITRSAKRSVPRNYEGAGVSKQPVRTA